ncbi:MFS-type transporter SLC18B1-like [Ptychodera flava]|uniref:MFS-type transporter SLC18B1-like n=1 Tax=Ptychodera flava TaxID=63121 RepID=UPI003969D7AA
MKADVGNDNLIDTEECVLSQTGNYDDTQTSTKRVQNGENIELVKEDLAEEEEPVRLLSMSLKLKVLLVGLCLTNYFYYTAFSMTPPLLPGVAVKHGVSEAQIGFILCIYGIAAIVQSSLSGLTIPKIGVRFGYLLGMLGASFTLISYGFLDKIDYEKTLLFIIVACLLRVTEALFATLGLNAAVAIIFHQFPKSVQSKILGTTNMFMGAGMTSGPLIGGILDDLGGYGLPFCVGGSCLLFTVAINYCVVDKDIDSSKTERGTSSVITLLRKAPAILVPAFVRLIIGIVISFQMPILAIYLTTQFLIRSKSIEGAMYSLLMLGYCIGSPIWGWIVGNNPKHLRSVILSGLVMLTVTVFLMGPCPWFHITPTLWLLSLCLFLAGICDAVGLITVVDIMNRAKLSGIKDKLLLSASVSGTYYTALSIGTTLGTFLGGLFYQLYGFGWTTTIVGFICVGTIIIDGAYMAGEYVFNERSMDREDIEINESTRLKGTANEKIPISEDFPQYTLEQ